MAPLAIAFWGLQSLAYIGGLELVPPWLVASGVAIVTLLLGALYVLCRERVEQFRVTAALAQKSAELQTQTATAVCLAREVEAARADLAREVEATRADLAREVEAARTEMQRVNVLERSTDLKTSKTALHREIVEREQAGVSLRESESNLLIAREGFQKDVAAYTEELERSNRELEQFAYVASHDLQEPLRAIAGCVQILERRYHDKLDSRGRELIGHTVEGVSRLQELIEGLLAFSRVSRLGGEAQPVSLESALATAVQQLGLAIEETNAVVEHEALPMVFGDRGRIVQLFQNVLGNALKYRAANAPHVRISTSRKENMWTIAIRDNGIGIERQYFGRVFSIFQRLHTRDEYPGTGIGLAICKRIVEHAGGAMWIESELGEGSTFYFTLPSV